MSILGCQSGRIGWRWFILLIMLFMVSGCVRRKIPWFKKQQHAHCANEPQKPLVIVIPSYNNRDWYRYNLDSVYQQHYANFRVIYVDDDSTDGTANLVRDYFKQHGYTNYTLIKNPTRRGALANTWRAINLCKKNEIILTLDGDDWLAHDHVLAYINHVYQDHNVWLTYGQFQNWPTKSSGWCEEIPPQIILANKFREHGFYFAQLRTFYAWLAQKIDQRDLLDPKTHDFYRVAGDVALMFPMVELAGEHIRFIDTILYYHNVQTPLNDFKVHHDEQITVTAYLCSKTPYHALRESYTTT